MFGVLPKGIRPDPSPEAGRIYSTPVGRALYNTTSKVLYRNFKLKPVGSDTVKSLTDRIASVFMENNAAIWQGLINVDSVNADPRLDEIVSFVSPMSRRMSAAEMDAFRAGELKKKLLIGGGIALVVLVVYALTRKPQGQ